MKNLEEIKKEILIKSSLSKDKKENIIYHRYKKIPKKLSIIHDRYRLDEKRVLEVGCAYGQVILQCGEGSFGVDINKDAIEFIKSMGIGGLSVDVDKNDLKEIPDNYFDLIHIADTLEHLESSHGLLVKLRDKLKHGGK